MREILFRGKRVDNGEWVEGNMYFMHECWGGGAYICPEERRSYNDDIEVIPETVGQYTGLKDKNGKRIFEGDIISATTIDEKEERLADIRYGEFYDCNANDLFLGWYVCVEGDCISMLQNDKEILKISKVIGNKHDNPELLKM